MRSQRIRHLLLLDSICPKRQCANPQRTDRREKSVSMTDQGLISAVQKIFLTNGVDLRAD